MLYRQNNNSNKPKLKRFQINWPHFSGVKRNFFILKVLYTKLLSCKTSNRYVFDCGLFLCNQLMVTFTPPAISLRHSFVGFGKYFYKNIRELQTFIKVLRFNIKNLYNLKLLSTVSQQTFFNTRNLVTLWSSNHDNSLFIKELQGSFSNNLKEFGIFFKIVAYSGLKLDFLNTISSDFNLYLLQLYLRLYDLEEILQWFNWLLFRSHVDKKIYQFYKPSFVVSFISDVRNFGYDFWHSNRFKQLHASEPEILRLKKKWRFWREFKKFLLFDKNHVFIKFKWLYNHKRVLSHQYLESYSTIIQSRLTRIYKKKHTQPRLFSYLFNFEFRFDILSMRVFNIKSIKWVWILLFFGYLTVNLNKKNKNYIFKIGDLLFGFFLVKNSAFFFKLHLKFYRPRKLYNFLEHEPLINSFICLGTPVKYSRNAANEDRLITKKFIKYTYLNTY
jgi:hypothetical protein